LKQGDFGFNNIFEDVLNRAKSNGAPSEILRLAKEVDDLKTEIRGHMKKIASMEKDREELLNTLAAKQRLINKLKDLVDYEQST